MTDAKPAFLSRDMLIKAAATARRIETLYVPEWNGTIRLRVMSGTERDAYEADIVGSRLGKDRRVNLQNMRAKLVARCMVDDKDAPMFDYRSPDDIGVLGAFDAAGLNRVFEACQRLNGLTDDDVAELEGKSVAAMNGVSGSH